MMTSHFHHLVHQQLVVCAQCQSAVWPNQINGHLQGQRHRMSRKEAAAIAEDVQGWPGVLQYPSEFQPPRRLDQPIPELPLYADGQACRLQPGQCYYVGRSINSIREHWRTEHQYSRNTTRGGSGKRKRTKVRQATEHGCERVQCQQFFKQGPGSQYIEVASGANNDIVAELARSDSGAAWERLVQKMREEKEKKEAKAQDTISEAPQDEGNPWLRRTGWDVYLKGLERSELLMSMEAPDEESDEPEVVQERVVWRAMDRMIQFSQESITERVGLFVRMEAVRSDPQQAEYAPLQPYQDEEQISKHMRPWQQMVMFFMRTQREHGWRSPRYQFTRLQQRTWEELLMHVEGAADDEEDADSELDDDDDDDDDDAMSVDDEGADGEISASPTPHPDAAKPQHLTAMQRACLRFCMALLGQRITRREYDSALICALSVLGVQESGWKDAHEYPQVLSSVVKVARFMVVQQALESSQPDELDDHDGPDSGYETDEPAAKGCLQLVQEMMERFMVRGTHSPMQWMLDLRAYGLKIHYSTTSQGHVEWMNRDELLYKELHFTMGEFRGMVHGLVGETRRILMEELMFISKPGEERAPEIPWSQMRDNPANNQPGWSFLKDRRTRMPVDGRGWLMDRVGRDASIRERFVRPGSGHMFDRRGVEGYMSRVVEFREKLMVLMHISGGQPARGPEILSIRHSNTSQGGHRNVFIEDGMVVFATRYHKGYTLRGDVKIIHRYLPRAVGELVVWYLWLVLPFQQELETYVWGHDEGSAYLWPSDPGGRKWTSERLRQVLKRESQAALGQQLTIQAYREIAIGISRRFMRESTAFHGDEMEKSEAWESEQEKAAIADEQAGHSSHVAGMVYARGVMEQLGVVASKRQQFRSSSQDWHEFFGFQEATQGISGSRKPAPFQAQAHDDRIDRWGRLRKMDVEQRLRQMMGPHSQFRGVQRAAVQAIVQGQSPIVTVMATGGGKSLLFMLPAWAEPGGTTVVVVPLIALREDMRRRCEKLGIPCEEWNRRHPPDGAAIVLVTPESAVSEDFMTFLNRLKSTRQLDRVVIDECHIVLNRQYTFRRTMQQLGRLASAETQMVLLTATLPPQEEQELFRRMYFEAEHVTTIRAATSRGNIAYRVVPMDGGMGTAERQGVMAGFVQQKVQQYGGGRIVVYCNTVREVLQLAEQLGCRGYHHHAEGKRQMLEEFTQGVRRVIVATSALGMGIDIPDIRCIIHADRPRTLLDYAQESGRAGRDGKSSEAVVFDGGRSSMARESMEATDVAEQELVSRFIQEGEGARVCRRVVLDGYLDGRTDRKGCETGEARCDVCGGIAERAMDSMDEAVVHSIAEAVDSERGQEQQIQQQQRQERARPRRVQMQQRRGEVREMEDMRRWLEFWRGRCAICEADGSRSSQHDMQQCPRSESRAAQAMVRTVEESIQFARFSGCFWCGIPQRICGRWVDNGRGGWVVGEQGRCEYVGVLIRTVVGIRFGHPRTIREAWQRRLEVAGVRMDDDIELIQYFGRRRRQEGVESNILVGEFIWFNQQISM